jgi:hypothetical protein
MFLSVRALLVKSHSSCGTRPNKSHPYRHRWRRGEEGEEGEERRERREMRWEDRRERRG